LRVRNGDPWLDVANRQGVLGGSWTRLGSEARWTSQMPCRCVAIGSKGASLIGSKGASEALLLLSGGKPGHAATSTRGQNRYTRRPRECPRRHDGRESDALPLCGDWLEGGQRSAAASFGRQTRARCDLNTRAESLHRRPRVSEAPQEGSRRLSWALRHSAFTCF